MTELTGEAMDASQYTSLDDEGAANTRAERHAYRFQISATGSKAHLRACSGVGVVVNDDGDSETLAENMLKWLVPPGEVRSEKDSAAEINEPGSPDSDGAYVVSTAELFDQVGDGVLDRGGREA